MLRELAAYYRPKDLSEALQLLSQPNTVPLAGGSELLGRKDASIQAVVDLQDLSLDYIRGDGDGLHIGAMTRLQTLITDPTARGIANAIIARCAIHSAQYTERNAATVGGTVAAAPPWHDLLPALLVVDTSVVLHSMAGRSVVPLEALLGQRRTHLGQGTLISEIIVPTQPAGARFAYRRASRTPTDRATVSVALRAAWDHEGRWGDVRIAVGGAGEFALRLQTVEPLLQGANLRDMRNVIDAINQSVTPSSDHIASREYRREMIGVLLQRALNEVGNA